jgi:hypothetical protein
VQVDIRQQRRNDRALRRPLLRGFPDSAFDPRGINILDLGGGNENDYKRRYGMVTDLYFPWFRKSRLASVEYLRSAAKELFWLQYSLRNKLRGNWMRPLKRT